MAPLELPGRAAEDARDEEEPDSVAPEDDVSASDELLAKLEPEPAELLDLPEVEDAPPELLEALGAGVPPHGSVSGALSTRYRKGAVCAI